MPVAGDRRSFRHHDEVLEYHASSLLWWLYWWRWSRYRGKYSIPWKRFCKSQISKTRGECRDIKRVFCAPQVNLCLYRCIRILQSGFIIVHKRMQEFRIAPITQYLGVCLDTISKGSIVLDADAIEVGRMIGCPVRLPTFGSIE